MEVVNAKYFPAYFEGLPENRMAALLWEGVAGAVEGKSPPRIVHIIGHMGKTAKNRLG